MRVILSYGHYHLNLIESHGPFKRQEKKAEGKARETGSSRKILHANVSFEIEVAMGEGMCMSSRG